MIVRHPIPRLLTFTSLLIERLWESFWLPVCVVLVFTALALLDVVFLFGNGGHLALFTVFAAVVAFLSFKNAGAFRLPAAEDIERRLEQENRLPHRPFATLRDQPAEPLSGDALQLWEKHIESARHRLETDLGIPLPAPDVARQDRHALRFAAILLFIVGTVVAGGDAPARIERGFTPDLSFSRTPVIAGLDVWIAPPDYTHLSPVFLSTAQLGAAKQAGAVSVPEGSILKVRVTGYDTPPSFSYAGEKQAFTKADGKNYAAELKLDKSGDIRIGHWYRSFGRWPVNVTPDLPPEIALIATGKTQRSALKITYQAKDDYGLAKITARVTPSGELGEKLGGASFTFDLSREGSHVEDLTAHPWAGMPALLSLEAADDAGHATATETQPFLLPERKFTNPVAERVIGERKRLIWFDDPLTRRIGANNLLDIASRPDLYKGDLALFLSLTTGARRLVYDGDAESVASVVALLWDVALQLEDGGLSLATRNLSESLQKLSEALNDKNMPQEEMQQLLDDVRQKMADYVKTLAKEMQQRMEAGKGSPFMRPEIAEKFMKHIDMNKLLEDMRRLSQDNSRESMQKMADYLKNAVDNLDLDKMNKMQEAQEKAMQSLQDLQDLIHAQQALLDKTDKIAPDDKEKSDKAANEQAQLRDKLGDIVATLSESLPQIPDNFAEANQSMNKSEKHLQNAKPVESVSEQKAALDALQQGMDDAIAQMAKAMQQTMLSFGPLPMGGSGEGFDPLGRRTAPLGSEKIDIPDEKEHRRVQEIIRELRDRSNDYQRPQAERDYLQRLLRPFE